MKMQSLLFSCILSISCLASDFLDLTNSLQCAKWDWKLSVDGGIAITVGEENYAFKTQMSHPDMPVDGWRTLPGNVKPVIADSTIMGVFSEYTLHCLERLRRAKTHAAQLGPDAVTFPKIQTVFAAPPWLLGQESPFKDSVIIEADGTPKGNVHKDKDGKELGRSMLHYPTIDNF